MAPETPGNNFLNKTRPIGGLLGGRRVAMVACGDYGSTADAGTVPLRRLKSCSVGGSKGPKGLSLTITNVFKSPI